MMTEAESLLGLTAEELSGELQRMGEPRYRAKQICAWLYAEPVRSFTEMANLPEALRKGLAERFKFEVPASAVQVSADGTRKYRLTLEDGEVIECVWIPEAARKTLCVSSQVGCALNCQFCVTGAVGYQRNLTAGEIVAQIRHVMLMEKLPVTNLVFMGMGEPLLNVENVVQAIRVLTRKEGFGFGKRKITVSTAGVVPQIESFVKATGVKLAISLTGATDASRNHWMPINKKYSLESLSKALRRMKLGKGRKITFEVVLMGGENDTEEEARNLSKYLSGIPAKVNLIPYNENPFFPRLKRPKPENVDRFRKILLLKRIQTMVRKNRGTDIMGACGQLAGRSVEPEVLRRMQHA
ncbi:MAG TPA: 23S rRNA (adenine(2503)-C(2))-methyltransferase RlmN [Bdellovibrionota bacterium]|nr:23S rRNA (adenine(2503)-C(2))-methyltransferase RlmN [Bdellovibrionota bacterium]